MVECTFYWLVVEAYPEPNAKIEKKYSNSRQAAVAKKINEFKNRYQQASNSTIDMSFILMGSRQ